MDPENQTSSFLGENNTFTDAFREALPGMIGDDYNNSDGEPTKVFDDVPDIATLSKNYLNTKRMTDTKISEAAQAQITEGGYTKPLGDDASPEDIAAFRKSAGIPESADGYGFVKPEDMPEGMEHDEVFSKAIMDVLHQANIPKGAADSLNAAYNAHQQKLYTEHLEAVDAEFTAASEQFNQLHSTPEKMTEFTRPALAAVKAFGDQELNDKIAELKLWETPGDLAKWREASIWPDQIMMWNRVGQKMASGMSHSNDNTSGNDLGSNTNTGGIYDHPDSKAAMG